MTSVEPTHEFTRSRVPGDSSDDTAHTYGRRLLLTTAIAWICHTHAARSLIQFNGGFQRRLRTFRTGNDSAWATVAGPVTRDRRRTRISLPIGYVFRVGYKRVT